MLERVAHHYVGIKLGSERKYRILAEAQRKGHPIEFDVLYYAESNRKRDILNEIGEKEGEYIRAYRPILNTQIPKEEDCAKTPAWNPRLPLSVRQRTLSCPDDTPDCGSDDCRSEPFCHSRPLPFAHSQSEERFPVVSNFFEPFAFAFLP